ncbi:hypothetical protein BGZ65_004823, partial [Modicella reniformis]
SYFNDELAAILDNVTQDQGSKLTSISLNSRSLTAVGVECMIRVIDHSHDLHRLDLTLDGLKWEHRQKTLERILSRYGKRLNGLEVIENSADEWIPATGWGNWITRKTGLPITVFIK